MLRSSQLPDSTGSTPQAQARRLTVALVHASNYDHADMRNGGSYVQTYARGVIPCNTLRVLHSLTLDALKSPRICGMETKVHLFEDCVRRSQKEFRRLVARFPKAGEILVVGLVGVQTNQFPRARDLCRSALDHGATVVWGGPHITASINASLKGIGRIDPTRSGVPCPERMPPEIQQLLETPGVIVFHGDADAAGAWRGVLEDIVAGEARSYYEAGLAGEIGPAGHVYPSGYLRSFSAAVAAIDTERGCPFKCSFCAAIQAHGRRVRSRDPVDVVEWVRRQCEAFPHKLTFLFASDNLARNPHWRELLAGLAELRAHGYRFKIWAEADVLCDTGPNRGFLEAYAAAGGLGLFFGIESMNPANLKAAGKNQNSVEKLHLLFDRCRSLGIASEGGYMIGFEHDTPESIDRDVKALAQSGMAHASFFIKTLLPGSQDWVEALVNGRQMDEDFNRYDSSVVSNDHERMTRRELTDAYNGAVASFYSPRRMIDCLAQYPDREARWRLIKSFIWYRWAYLVEKAHPMIAGMYRHRPYRERRRGYCGDSYVRHCIAEVWRHLRYIGLFLREFYLFQQVILEAEFRAANADCRVRLDRSHQEWSVRATSLAAWGRGTFGWPMRRSWLNDFWVRYGRLKWKLLNPLYVTWHAKMLPYAISEVVYTARFTVLFLRGLRT